MEAYFTEYQRLFYHSRYYHNRPLELGWDFPWYDPKLIFFFFVFPYLFLDHRNPIFVCGDRFVFTSSCTTYHYLSWVVLPDGDVTDICGAIGLVWPGPSGIGMLNDS